MKTKVLRKKSKSQKSETSSSNSEDNSKKFHDNHFDDYTSLKSSKYPMIILHDILHTNSSILLKCPVSLRKIETDKNKYNNLEMAVSKELSCSKQEEVKLPVRKRGRPRIKNKGPKDNEDNEQTMDNKKNTKENQGEECRLVPEITNIKTEMKKQIKLRECSVQLVRCTFKPPSYIHDDKGFITENSEIKAHSVLPTEQVNGIDVNSSMGESNCRADISSTVDISCSEKNSKSTYECSTKKCNSLKNDKISHSNSVVTTAKRKLPQLIYNCVLPKHAFDPSTIAGKRLSVDTVVSFNKKIKQKHFGAAKQTNKNKTKKANANVEPSKCPVMKSPKKIEEITESSQLIWNRSMPLLDETINDNEKNNNIENKQYLEHHLSKNNNSLKTESDKVDSSKSKSCTCMNVENATNEDIMDEDDQVDYAISDFLSSCIKNRISQVTNHGKQKPSNNNEIRQILSHRNDIQQSTELIETDTTETVHTKKTASPKISCHTNISTLVESKEINNTETLTSEGSIGVQSLTTNNLEKFNLISSSSHTTSYAEKYVKSIQKTRTFAEGINIERKCENEQRSTVTTSLKRGWAEYTDMGSEKTNKKKIKLDRNNWKKHELTKSNQNHLPNGSSNKCDTSILSETNASTVNENRKPISFHVENSTSSATVVMKPVMIKDLAAEPKQHSLNLEEKSRKEITVDASQSSVEQSKSAEVCQYVTKNEDAASKEKVTAKDKEENKNDSDDDDCISILCDPDVIDDLARDLEDDIAGFANKPASIEEYTLTNKTWNNYVEKNKREAEEDLKSFAVSNIYSGVTFTEDTTVNSTKTLKSEPVTTNHTIIKDSLKENYAPSLSTTTTVTKTNVRSRLGCEVTNKKEKNIPVALPHFFYGHCFQKMQHGLCFKKNCSYSHNLTQQMLSLHTKNYAYIRSVMESAVKNDYRYFIQYMYNELIKRLEPIHILDLYTLIHKAKYLNNNSLQRTVDALIEKAMSIKEFVSLLTSLLDGYGISALYGMILKHAEKKIAFGEWWRTFRQLFIKFIPPVPYVQLIIQECLVAQEDEEFIDDVYVNLVSKLTIGHSEAPELCNVLPPFFKLHDRIKKRPENSNNVNIQVVQDDSTSFTNVISPLVTALANYNVDDGITTSIKKSEQYVFQLLSRTTHDTIDTEEPQLNPPCNLSTLESPVNSLDSTVRLDICEGERSNVPSNESTQIECDFTNKLPYVTDVPWVIHRIDNLPTPRSPYHHRFWKFNIDLASLREGLRHRDYAHVLQILNKYSKNRNSIFLRGCYNMLRNNIMSSDEHLANIIKISVQTGMSSNLEETLFTLGVYVLTELADNGSWVLAYKLLKTLQIYESRFNTGFILLSAEIYLANDRPLKALEVLRQTNVIFTNRKKWKLPSETRDEDLRVMIITLLLDSLCGNFPDSAFALYDTLLGDQYCIYFPIDLPRCVDRITLALLTAEKYDLVIELARLLIPFNLMLRPNILRAVTVTATTCDMTLAKQLFQYGTKLGAYQAIKINTPIFLTINTRWTEEEMYLAVTELIQRLFVEIGHGVDHMSIKQLVVYASFETVPSSKELQLSEIRKHDNRLVVQSSKQIMANILATRFDPPLAFVKSYTGRFAKFNSTKLLNYLKSTHVEL